MNETERVQARDRERNGARRDDGKEIQRQREGDRNRKITSVRSKQKDYKREIEREGSQAGDAVHRLRRYKWEIETERLQV